MKKELGGVTGSIDSTITGRVVTAVGLDGTEWFRGCFTAVACCRIGRGDGDGTGGARVRYVVELGVESALPKDTFDWFVPLSLSVHEDTEDGDLLD